MRVVQAVMHHPALPPGFHDSGRSQQSQRMGDICLGRPGGGGEIADAEFARLEQGVEMPGAGGISEQAEEFREVGEFVFGKELCFRGCDALSIDNPGGTAIES